MLPLKIICSLCTYPSRRGWETTDLIKSHRGLFLCSLPLKLCLIFLKGLLKKEEEEGWEGEEEEKEDKKEDGGKRRHNVTEIACGIKTKNIYHLVFSRKSLPTSALEYEQDQILCKSLGVPGLSIKRPPITMPRMLTQHTTTAFSIQVSKQRRALCRDRRGS